MDTEDEISVDPADSPYSSDSPSEREQDGITRGHCSPVGRGSCNSRARAPCRRGLLSIVAENMSV